MGELVAGLSVAGPAYRISKKKVSSYGKLVIQYAQKIYSKLSYA
jgi:DNA-binding IclR family transcriptional regulator